MTEFEGIESHLERAREEYEEFDPPENPDERALNYLREGLWPLLERYIEARSGSRSLSLRESGRLDRALNAWLELYTLCYGVEIHATFPSRAVAEMFVETHDLRDTAQLLTHVPDRR